MHILGNHVIVPHHSCTIYEKMRIETIQMKGEGMEETDETES